MIFALEKIFRFNLLSEKIKKRLHKVLMRRVILYTREKWRISKEYEKTRAILEWEYDSDVYSDRKKKIKQENTK